MENIKLKNTKHNNDTTDTVLTQGRAFYAVTQPTISSGTKNNRHPFSKRSQTHNSPPTIQEAITFDAQS